MNENLTNEHKIKMLETEVSQLKKKVEKSEDDIKDILINNSAQAERDKYIMEKLDKLTLRVEELTNVPRDRWNIVIASIITAIIGVLVGKFL